MRTAILLAAVLATTGCSATKSALGALTGTKPNQVNVAVQSPPVNVTVNNAPVAPPEKKHGRLDAAAKGALAGMVVGGLVGYARHGATQDTAKLVLVGAGAGAATGVAIHEIDKD